MQAFTPYINPLEASYRSLFRRCVVCPPETPICPTCKSDEQCIQNSPDCNTCAFRSCAKLDASAANGNSGPNVGAIAGGVIGGIAAILILTFLVWWFFIRGRRQPEDDFVEAFEEKDHTEFNARRDARASTGSVRSVASTMLTRASNIIQIAFIPGITDRSGSDADHSPAPPVPSIPLHAAQFQPLSPTDSTRPTTPYSDTSSAAGDHYFMPADLSRNSAFSGYSDIDAENNRISRATMASRLSHATSRPDSLTPSLARVSMASTAYAGDASIVGAQTVQRTKANVISVRPGTSTTPGDNVPQVPSVDYFKYAAGSADGAVPGIAIDSSAAAEGATRVTGAQPSNGSLTTAIQEATRRASQQPTHGGLGAVHRDPSPFADEHAITP